MRSAAAVLDVGDSTALPIYCGRLKVSMMILIRGESIDTFVMIA
jgi:hypothetical protein